MINLIHSGLANEFFELRKFENYVHNIGAITESGEGDLSEKKESREYFLKDYNLKLKYFIEQERGWLFALGKKEDISNFKVRLTKDMDCIVR